MTFLGTGTSQGVPVIACKCDVCLSSDQRDNRTRSSVIFEVGGRNIVVDTGPDFRQQMLREDVQKLDAVLYTHSHKDHIAGMDDIRPYCFKQRPSIPLFASEEVQQALRTEYAYAFVEDELKRYPGSPTVELQQITDKPFECVGVEVIPIKVKHGIPYIYGFRIGDIAYITDANYIDGAELNKIRGSRVVVLNALRTQPHHSHFTLAEALEVISEIAPEQAYLTHISHLLGLHETVDHQLPEGVNLAYDGLTVVT